MKTPDSGLSRPRNPWAGLSSYRDPETEKYPHLFCGRDDESYDVSQLIDNNIFVTLYGRSGTGKTSLLNAGVFPWLRKENYLPVSIRLEMDARDGSFQQCVIDKLSLAIAEKGSVRTRDVVPMPDDECAVEYLWCYFARNQFLNHEGQVLFPVIVFDQFEEVFRNRRPETETLLTQIHFMMDESHALSDRTVDGEPYTYDFNFRFVVAIREDDLYRLEDSIDNHYLTEMKRCRFRLRNLKDRGAREAVMIPGGDLFKPDEQERIVETILGMARNSDDGTVSANILSLVCSRIYEEFLRTGAQYIDLPMVDRFVRDNPFERFYNEATRGFSNRERSYIETNLIDSSGRRNSVAESDFLKHVPNGAKLLEGSGKILQRTATSSGGRIELSHDSFCEPLKYLKEKRERRRRAKWIAGALLLALLGVASGVFFRYQSAQIAEAQLRANDAEYSLALLKGGLSSEGNTVRVGESSYLVDDIRYDSESLTPSEITAWCAEFRDICQTKIEKVIEYYTIPKLMLERDPCLVYLVIRARSLESIPEKQEWFDLYPRMDESQINQLYDILYREAYRLAVTDAKYMERKDSINAAKKEGPAEKMDLNSYLTDEELVSEDGIRYFTGKIARDADLNKWCKANEKRCLERVEELRGNLVISRKMLRDHPCLVYLILDSESLATEADKQEWLDLYKDMNRLQISQLYSILYKEAYILVSIREKKAQLTDDN